MRTQEEIMEAVQNHHNSVVNYVGQRNGDVLMTVLIGSQNYDIAGEESDIDTYSFVLPSIGEIAALRDPMGFEYELKDGKCCVKDMRTALNLLMKTNPNSVEWFCSDYVVYNPTYEKILKRFLRKNKRKNFLYCDVYQMFNSCKGMAKQLKNRNMPAGKKYSHALRIRDMYLSYITADTDNILKFRDEETKSLAAEVKRCTDDNKNEYFQKESEKIADEISTYTNLFDNNLNDNLVFTQKQCKKYVIGLQTILTMKHLALQISKIYD